MSETHEKTFGHVHARSAYRLRWLWCRLKKISRRAPLGRSRSSQAACGKRSLSPPCLTSASRTIASRSPSRARARARGRSSVRGGGAAVGKDDTSRGCCLLLLLPLPLPPLFLRGRPPLTKTNFRLVASARQTEMEERERRVCLRELVSALSLEIAGSSPGSASHPVFASREPVSGVVEIRCQPGKRLEHLGVKVELVRERRRTFRPSVLATRQDSFGGANWNNARVCLFGV